MINIGHFYYLNDKYFIDFPDQNLMNNKETIVNDTIRMYI